jgi:hypothetical protein
MMSWFWMNIPFMVLLVCCRAGIRCGMCSHAGMLRARRAGAGGASGRGAGPAPAGCRKPATVRAALERHLGQGLIVPARQPGAGH